MPVKSSLRCAHQWGKCLGRLIYLFDIPHRRIARSNLKFAFPDWPPKKIEVNIKRVYEHFAISVLEFIQFSLMAPEEVIKHSRLTGENYLHQALNKGNGVILISAHIGNWEVGLHFLTYYFKRPITLVTRKLKPKLLDDLFTHFRAQSGNKIMNSKGTFNKMVKTLRQGNILALMADLPRKKYSVEINFLGHRSRSAYAVALLSILCESPVIPAFTYRDTDGFICLELGAPVDIIRRGKLRTDLQINTQRISDIVEEAVYRRPDQWLWMQKRWKDCHPQLYPSYLARRKKNPIRDLKPPSHLN